MHVRSYDDAEPFVTADGSLIRELLRGEEQSSPRPRSRRDRRHSVTTTRRARSSTTCSRAREDGSGRRARARRAGRRGPHPAGAWHEIRNDGAGDLRFLCCCARRTHTTTRSSRVKRAAAARPAPRAVLHAPARAGAGGGRARRRAARRSRARQSRHPAAGAHRRGARGQRARADDRYARLRAVRRAPALREAIAARYATEYGVELDPHREVAVVPGTKTALTELVLALAERGDTVLLPDPYYPDYPSGIALAGAQLGLLQLDPDRGYAPRFDLARAARERRRRVPQLSVQPDRRRRPGRRVRRRDRVRARDGRDDHHDFAYGDLVFDGRERRSFLAEPGAREVGVELFSMSKSYGMAGWRLGFVLGNAELVARVTTLQDHARAGIFTPVQRAGIAALTRPQDTVASASPLRAPPRPRRRRARRPLRAVRGNLLPLAPAARGADAGALLLASTGSRSRRAEGFGPSGAGWARLSLATPDELIDLGLERLLAAL